jgi:hypothetical protein
MAAEKDNSGVRLSDLPLDELRAYAHELGLELPDRMPHADMLRAVRQRQELLLDLDREAMLDIVVWARLPVRQSASKEQLAKRISTVDRMHFDGLSHRGLVTLARLRDLDVRDTDSDEHITSRLKKSEPLVHFFRRKRRWLIGTLLEKTVLGQPEPKGEYRFLPEDPGSREPRFRQQVEEQGIVAGLAGKLRTVADDYIAEKLDEIEHRIDQKLDEIDARLAEWRDREVASRLKIIKITLVASVIVAMLSLGYKYISTRAGLEQPTSRPATSSLLIPAMNDEADGGRPPVPV